MIRRGAEFNKNNLDLLRLVLASLVFLFHISALTDMPAFSALGKYVSAPFAVRSFFVISGLLIYRSYTHSSSTSSYFEKRARRIYPAYFAIVLLAALALCPLSTLHASQYFGIGFWKYLGANLVFLNFLAPSLPGVFMSNSISAVNGALWTLKIEIAFYFFVPVMHYLCNRFGTKRTMCAIFFLSCAWKYGFGFLASLDRSHSIYSIDSSRNIYQQLEVQFPAQLVYFCAGILLYLYFDKLKEHFVAVTCIAACFFAIDHWFTKDALDVIWISGMVFVTGFWRYLGKFSKHGDYSYGVYIVHWPILQVLIAFGLATKLDPKIFLLVCLSSVGFAAVIMWNMVESRFLSSNSHYRQVAGK